LSSTIARSLQTGSVSCTSSYHSCIPRTLPTRSSCSRGAWESWCTRSPTAIHPPETTEFGDLGGELAQRILSSEVLSKHVQRFVPENGGRATVYGITLHSTEVSGATLFLRNPGALPLRDLPLVAHLPTDVDESVFREALMLVQRSERGACLQISSRRPSRLSLQEVLQLGKTLATAFVNVPPPNGVPIVLLLTENVGKAVGNYAADWGRSSLNLIVIDEIQCAKRTSSTSDATTMASFRSRSTGAILKEPNFRLRQLASA
jgi:hypothetical protein